MKGCMLTVITLCVFSCSKDDPNPVNPGIPDSTVYLAGNAGGGSYWKNGVYSTVGDNGNVWVQSMSVEGSSVLIGGFICCSDTRNVIWQNGVETLIEGSGTGGLTLVTSRGNDVFGVVNGLLYKNGTTTRISDTGWPTAMALLGDDVYIAGASQGNDYPWMVSSFYPLDTYAICWKNDQEFFRENEHSYANTIFIHYDDIYLGGHLNHYPSLDKIACYWKNGQRVKLTEERQDAEVTSLFVTDTNVYAAGVINDQAVYWKDGVAIFLSNGATNSIANSISVLGTDVYVAGREDKYPAVWKNGVKQNIPNQDKQGEIKVVVAIFELM
jgi:hypothetical protein